MIVVINLYRLKHWIMGYPVVEYLQDRWLAHQTRRGDMKAAVERMSRMRLGKGRPEYQPFISVVRKEDL